jgi:glycosyltransferase involved in cell wall biosynthesis
LIEKKGHDVLIEACALLAASGSQVRCEIVGEGPERPRLEALIVERGLADRVILRGALSHEAALAAIVRGRICVLASVASVSEGEDGIPVVLMEAMARGRPTVATRLSGIPELVVDGETGLLVPPGDAQALSAAIGRLIDDGGLAERLGESGRKKVAAEYDASACYGRAAALLAGVADARDRQGE